ncbi:MAG TPA: SRPBCC family protein [Acidimicrobiales bacterium]|nr:SRPBCC family protein [Acidimicrobiales bacterium]
MQRHEVSFTVDAPPHRVWRLFHPKTLPGVVVPRTFAHPGGAITILRDGDEDGAGLVRTCTFRVPRWLLSGGMARSWEVVTDARKNEYATYEAIGKPLWSTATGTHTLEPVKDGEATRLTFVETYHAHSPVLRALFEARVHRFISRDNTRAYDAVLGRLGAVTMSER